MRPSLVKSRTSIKLLTSNLRSRSKKGNQPSKNCTPLPVTKGHTRKGEQAKKVEHEGMTLIENNPMIEATQIETILLLHPFPLHEPRMSSLRCPRCLHIPTYQCHNRITLNEAPHTIS